MLYHIHVVPLWTKNVPLESGDMQMSLYLGTFIVPLGTSNVPLGTSNVPLGTSNVPLWTSNVPLGTRDVSLGNAMSLWEHVQCPPGDI